AVADVNTIAEDAASVAGNVLANDTDVDAGAELTVAEVEGEADNVGVAVAGAYGQVTINADGSYSYALNNALAAVQSLNVGQTLTDSFSYTVTDEHGATSQATLTITITGTNDGAHAGAAVTTIAEKPASVAGNVLANDTDVDAGAELAVAEVDGVADNVGVAVAGAYALPTRRSSDLYSYALNNALAAVQSLNVGQTLTDSFSYTVTDEHGATSQATLTITITG